MSSGLLSGGHFFNSRIDVILAYGNYNDLVLDASGIRGQSVVIWDFEWVDYLWCTFALEGLIVVAIFLAHKIRSARARRHQRIYMTKSSVGTRVTSLR